MRTSLKLDALYILLSLATVNAVPIYSVEWRHGLPYNIPLGIVLILLSILMGAAYHIGRAVYLIGFQQREEATSVKDILSVSYESASPYVKLVIVVALLQLALLVLAAMSVALLVGVSALALVAVILLGDLIVLPCILYKTLSLGECSHAADYLKAIILIGIPGIILNFTVDLIYTSLLDTRFYYPYIWPLSGDAARMLSEGQEPWFPTTPSIIATIIYARIITLIKDTM